MARSPAFVRFFAAVAVAFPSAGGFAAGQGWNATINSGAPVLHGGFQVVHDNGTDIVGFSAMTQRFTPIVPSAGGTIEGVGDWCTLVRSGGGYVAWSARTEQLSPLPAAFDEVLFDEVADDVALVVGRVGASWAAWGYSAQTGNWVAQPLSSSDIAATDYAISRFVIGVADRTAGRTAGFSARIGAWVELDQSGDLAALGNVLLVRQLDRCDAWSGVLGMWTEAPTIDCDCIVMVSHNLGYVRTLTGSGFSPCVYSAYDGTWVVSPSVYSLAAPPLVESISDNVMYVEGDAGGSRFAEAIGARPHLSWSSWSGSGSAASLLIGQEADYAIVKDGDLAAFSGLCDGSWLAMPYSGAPGLKAGVAHHALIRRVGTDEWLAYSPLHHAVAVLNLPGSVSTNGGTAISIVHNGARRFAYSARSNQWVEGPGFAGTLNSATGGATHLSGPSAGLDVVAFNERIQAWEAPMTFASGFSMGAGRNLAIVIEPMGVDSRVWAYSLQRGDWVDAGRIPGAPYAGPVLDENVAFLLANDGLVHVYGSPNEIHTWFDHPNGSEFHVQDPIAGGAPDTSVHLSLFGPPLANVFGLWSVATLSNGITIGKIENQLWLDPSYLSWVTLGPLPADGLMELEIELDEGGPVCAEIWAQSLVVPAKPAPKSFSHRATPIGIK